MSDEMPTIEPQGDLEGDAHVDVVTPGKTAEFQMPTAEESAEKQAEAQAENLLAGKYKDVKELEQAYLEAQKMISQKQSDPTSGEQAPQETEMQIQHGPFQGSVTEVLEAAGIEGNDIAKEWQSQGKLTEDMYDKLAGLGWQRQVVDTFVQGQFAVAANEQQVQVTMKQDAIEMAGGDEAFANLYRFAGTHYNEAQQENLNERLADRNAYKGAIKEMMYDYQAETGTSMSKPLTAAQAPSNVSAEGFKTTQEVRAAFAQLKGQGFIDEVTKAKIARTPQHLLEGVEG